MESPRAVILHLYNELLRKVTKLVITRLPVSHRAGEREAEGYKVSDPEFIQEGPVSRKGPATLQQASVFSIEKKNYKIRKKFMKLNG